MTNREKFKEVFGYDLKEDDEPCIATFTDMPFDCAARTCCDCQMVNFWDEEYQKPIDLEEVKMQGLEKIFYLCDPEKNVECMKTECQGLCFYTTKKECSKDGREYYFNGRILIPVPEKKPKKFEL